MNEVDRIVSGMSPTEVMGYWTLGGSVSRSQLNSAVAALDEQMDAELAKRQQRDAKVGELVSEQREFVYTPKPRARKRKAQARRRAA